jgi:hypothetical protein
LATPTLFTYLCLDDNDPMMIAYVYLFSVTLDNSGNN